MLAPGHDPVHETGLHERNERRVPEAGGSERAADSETDRHIGVQHLVRKNVAGFAKPSRVVGEEELVDKGIDPDAARDGHRVEPAAVHYRRTAAETTVVQTPPEAPSAVCVMLVLSTI